MLAADKLQLQSQLKQQATALKEKEFNLHHSNLMTVGTQAAVLAGLDITMFIEFNPPSDESWGVENLYIARTLKVLYYAVIVGAFCANIVVVAHTTTLSVLGAGMAVRGPDGSMMTATDGLYEERPTVFRVFGLGLALTVGSVLVSVWLLLRWEAASICWLVALYTCKTMWRNYTRVSRRFDYDESETVDFSDIMEGPAAIRGVPFVSSQQYSRKKVPKSPKRSPAVENGGGDSSYFGTTTGESEDSDMENQRLISRRMSHGSTRLVERKQRHHQQRKLDPIQTI